MRLAVWTDIRGAFSRQNIIENIVGLFVVAALNLVWPVLAHAVLGLTWPWLVPLGIALFLLLAAGMLYTRRKHGYGFRKAVEMLRDDGTEYTAAGVIFFPPHQYRMAERMASMFELAGWSANFTKVPLETAAGFSRYVEGIEVQGRNAYLVGRVVRALTTAGFPMVEPAVEDQPTIHHGHPKYDLSMGSIQVCIGHTPERALWSE